LERETNGDLLALLALLNSAVIDWYFRVANANNHVANYELDDLPTCLDDKELRAALAAQAALLSEAYAFDPNAGRDGRSALEDSLDALVAFGFGLTDLDSQGIFSALGSQRSSRVCGMLRWLRAYGIPDSLKSAGRVLMHIEPTLSQLDLEMIRHVPQGANWQHIPKTVRSARLAQIRQMTAERGVVRTTYYGRLRPEQPAYTISTYYNRPGNGTNIHPWEDRTLTAREAARLQSFPDWYFFLGNEGNVRKQIGNAVPPLLAFAIGKTLMAPGKAGLQCVDMFAGAGGLSLGLELAGWHVGAAVDSDLTALSTYAFNRACEDIPMPGSSSTLAVRANLSDPAIRADVLRKVREKLGNRPPDLLVGGPPCQGFSHAGWRRGGDIRNDLAVAFLEFVEALSPNTVCLENVEGLLTYDRGRVVDGLLRVLSEFGYNIDGSPWKLFAEQYGVPQMRRRVFLIGRRDSPPPPPPAPTFTICRGRREDATLRFEADPITVAEAIGDLPPLGPRRFMPVKQSIDQSFAKWARGMIGADQFLALRGRSI
jgi:DNA (cytosine-5)-methyltransferase 1